jgi:hypothetical protein
MFGSVGVPASQIRECGFGLDSGTFTATSSGQYIMTQSYSMVPGSDSPQLVFTGVGEVGINNRGWTGGATYSVEASGTLSHEVLAGGGTTINNAGANVEIRGVTRSVTLSLSEGGSNPQTQFVGVTGPISITGTSSATSTINLYGVSSSLADTSSNTSVNDYTTSRTNYNGGDYALNTTAAGNIGIDWANVENPLTEVDLSNTSISGTDQVANAVWESLLADHTTSNTFGSQIKTTIPGQIAISAAFASAAADNTVTILADTTYISGVVDDINSNVVEDSAPEYTVAALVMAGLRSDVAGTVRTIRKTDGTVMHTQTVAVDATADPITGVS